VSGSHGAPEAIYPVVHVAPPSGVLQTPARAGLATKSRLRLVGAHHAHTAIFA